MNCTKCGTPLNPTDRFCTTCGAVVNQPAQPGYQGSYQQPTYQQPTYQEPVYQQPAYQQPIQPAYQQPTYQEPVQPAYQQPTYQEPVQPAYQQPTYQEPVQPVCQDRNMTWKEFYDRFVEKKSFVTWATIICFATPIISLLLSIVFESTGIGLIADIAVYAISGVLLLTTKHWIAALVPSIYGGIFTVIGMANGSAGSGIVALVVCVSCTTSLFKADKAYRQYKQTGILPTKKF